VGCVSSELGLNAPLAVEWRTDESEGEGSKRVSVMPGPQLWLNQDGGFGCGRKVWLLNLFLQ
jgi:hypothetical protein